MTNYSVLRSEWIRHSQQWLGTDESLKEQDIKATFEHLCQCYAQESRHYHSIQHIISMLEMARQQQSKIKNGWSVYFAIWFHDAVQGIGINGEAESAALCGQYLALINAPQELISSTCNMILATREHPFDANGDLALFLDLDLAILGAKWPKYLEYSNNTRLEYPVPQWLYRRGRKKFLKSQLAKPKLFNTDLFARKFEHQARCNLQQELLIL